MNENVVKTAVITGATSGLGTAIVDQFGQRTDFEVYGVAEKVPTKPMPDNYKGTLPCDLTDPLQTVGALAELKGTPVHVLINCAGVNYIDWMQDITVEWWDRVMNTNARALWIVTSRLLEELKAAEGTVMNVVSNAAKVPMTHSIAYNASKGAAAIMTRQMARELQKEHGICVFGICPNKLRGTRMSKYIEGRVCELRGWTREQADEYQLKALLAGKETDPYQVAELVVWLLTYKHRHDYLTGCLLELGL